MIFCGYYTTEKMSGNDRSTWVPSIVSLLLYGIISSLSTFHYFFDVGPNWAFACYSVIWMIRFLFMLASSVWFFTTQGREIIFGFLILTSIIIFIVQSILSFF